MMMVENPYETPHAEPSASVVGKSQPAGNRRIRLSVFFANCLLLVLFPPTCCPCGLGPIGFLALPYMLLLGCPTILFGFLAREAIETHREVFFAAYIVNYVVMSYLVGEFAGWLFGRRQVRQTVSCDNGGCSRTKAIDAEAGTPLA
jgi:hypothetical protein